MAGRTGYTAITNASAMQGPAQMTDIYKHFDALVGESRATVAELPITGNWAGRVIYCLDDKTLRLWDGAQWVVIFGTQLFAFAFAGIYKEWATSPVKVVAQGGRVSLEGSAASTSATFVAGTSYTLGSVPASLAPATAQAFACTANNTAVASVTVAPSGSVSFIVNVGFTGVLTLGLAGTSWRLK